MIRLINTADKLAQKWLDRGAHRSPRGLGFSIDEGLPDRGERYGGAQTIHNTGTIDIVVDVNTGRVSEVWFRCMNLAANVSVRNFVNSPYSLEQYKVDGKQLVAVEIA